MNNAKVVVDKIYQLLMEQLGLEQEEINLGDRLVENLGADSLDLVEIVIGLEEEFDIEILDEEAEQFGTVGQIVDYMLKKTKLRPANRTA